MRYEHLKTLLVDEEALELLWEAAERLANADIPPEIARALALGRMTALQKSGAQRRVRGIVVGDTFRRLVAKTLAKQYSKEFADTCAPHQFGVATPGGTDCVTHLLRAKTEGDEDSVLVSLDGVGAYVHASRATLLAKLATLPKAHVLLPFILQYLGSHPHTSGTIKTRNSTRFLRERGASKETPSARRCSVWACSQPWSRRPPRSSQENFWWHT